MQPRSLAVIPARGGSKRLPRKNIKNLLGHPLIAYTICAAQNSALLTDFIVSSDDDEIIQIAKSYGANVPFKRPDTISSDATRNNETLAHALSFMEECRGVKYDLVIMLQPTSPVRDSRHIDLAIQKLCASDLETLASVKGPFKKRQPTLKRVKDSKLVPYADKLSDPNEAFYLYNAALYAAKRQYFVETSSYFSDEQEPLFMDRLCSLDIDDENDFAIVEMLMKTHGISFEEAYRDDVFETN
jgi:CMP-N,N'-diacetyllegionaminic acid synthase